MKGTPYTVEIKSEQEAQIYRFSSSDGVLSKDEVRGSVLELMESTDFEGDENVLNVDCNYGITGILTASSLNTGGVIMTDSSARAVKLAEMNIRENNIENAEVHLVPWIRELESDDFDTVLYPPNRLTRMISSDKRYLRV